MSAVRSAGCKALRSISSLPPECWSIVGEQIRSPQTLKALVRTCHAFRDIFTPFLYHSWRLELAKYSPSDLVRKSLSLPPGICHTRDFEIVAMEFLFTGSHDNPYEITMNKSYAKCITKMLKEMTTIRSFRWVDAAFTDSYGPPLILRHPELLRILKESQTLKHVSIEFASQWLEDRIAARNCSITLKGFRNLTSLEVYHFYGDEERILKDLVSALVDSPHLQTLGLALACDCDCDALPEAVIMDFEFDFLENLCVEYGSRKPTSPLPLKTLKLGHGMYLLKSESTVIDNYLAKLVKISDLRTLHIFNGLMKWESIDEETESMEIEWSLFKECRSLHQLSVTRLEDDVRQWLNTVGNSVQELIVTEHIGIYDAMLENFSALNLPHLSMLFTTEKLRSKPDSEEEWSDTDSFDSQVNSQSVSQSASEPGSSEEESEDATDTDSKPASPLHVDRSIMTVLDRLHDGGSKLTMLSLELEFETQWVHFSSHLSKMPYLNQLYIRRRIAEAYQGQYPTKESSLWRTAKKPKDIACRYAKLMKDICPSLQYIRIHDWTWEFFPRRKFKPSSSGPMIRELEYDEVRAFEILSFETLTSQGGLPCPEYPPEEHVPVTEEERIFFAQRMSEYEAAILAGDYDEF